MKKNQILLVILLILITNLIVVSENSRNCIKPKDGFVPDKETTIKIAEAVWYPIYGERINNKKSKGFTGKKSRNIWLCGKRR